MSSAIPAVTIVTTVGAIIAVALFFAGYLKGFTASIDEHALPQSEVQDSPSRHRIWPICLAVAASGVVIALLGVSPLFIVLAPFLSIASAAVIGLLFFIEPHLDK